MTKKIPVFNYELCVACGICSMSCPVSAINLTKTDVDDFAKGYPQVDEKCVGCGICAKTCPIEAIAMKNK